MRPRCALLHAQLHVSRSGARGHNYACRACVFGRINFGDLVQNSPIRQIKIPAKVSGYTVPLKY